MAFYEVTAHGGRIHAVTCWHHDTTEIKDSGPPPADSYESAAWILRTVVFEESEYAS